MAFHETEKCFRRYEAVIAKALESYPESVRFKSDTRQASTDAARCTNALAAYRRNRWCSSHAVFATFEDRPLSVWLEGDHCVIGPPMRSSEIQIISGQGSGVHGAIQCVPGCLDHVLALIRLVNDGVIKDPVQLPREWKEVAEANTKGLINIAIRVENTSIILF